MNIINGLSLVGKIVHPSKVFKSIRIVVPPVMSIVKKDTLVSFIKIKL